VLVCLGGVGEAEVAEVVKVEGGGEERSESGGLAVEVTSALSAGKSEATVEESVGGLPCPRLLIIKAKPIKINPTDTTTINIRLELDCSGELRSSHQLRIFPIKED